MSAPKTYKPNDTARVEAMLFAREPRAMDDALQWCIEDLDREYMPDGTNRWVVKTLEGWVEIPFGHYLIKGTNGEFYPCDPDVFENRWVEVNPTSGG